MKSIWKRVLAIVLTVSLCFGWGVLPAGAVTGTDNEETVEDAELAEDSVGAEASEDVSDEEDSKNVVVVETESAVAETIAEESSAEDDAITVAASLEDEESGIATVSEGEDTDVIASGTCGDDLTWTLDSDYALTISGTGDMTDWDSHSDVPWYSYRSSISSVTISDGVTSIGHCAFYGCTGLTSVDIPDSVTSIDNHAFAFCYNLTSVAIPDSVTSIGIYAFHWCESLTSANIPDSVTSISNGAFSYCESLTSVAIPDSVTSIGERAFCDCTSLTSVTIPDSVTSIGEYAFAWCEGLTSVTIGCGVASIGDCAFYDCESLTSVAIPDSVTSIGERAFCDCTSLTSVTIPDSVTSIGECAFGSCTSLTSITLGSGVTSIGEIAFYSCTNLTDVYYAGSEEDWAAINIGSGNVYLTSATIHYNSTGPEDEDADDTDTEKLTLISEIDVSKYDEDQSAYTDTYDSLEIGDELLLSVEVTVDEDVAPTFDASDWECDDETVIALGDLSVIGPQTSEDYDGMVVYYISITADVVGEGNSTVTFTAPNDRKVSVDIEVGVRETDDGLRIYVNTPTNCLCVGVEYELYIGYYANDTLSLLSDEFITVVSDNSIVDITPGSWSDEMGRYYKITALSTGTATITFTDPNTSAAKAIEITVVDKEMVYNFQNIPEMTIESGSITNFYNYAGMVVDDFSAVAHTDSDGNIDYYTVTMNIYNTKEPLINRGFH